MSCTQTCRRCIGLLDTIAENVEQATAFGPEARHMHAKVADLKLLLDEFMTGRYQDGVFEAALEVRLGPASFPFASLPLGKLHLCEPIVCRPWPHPYKSFMQLPSAAARKGP